MAQPHRLGQPGQDGPRGEPLGPGLAQPQSQDVLPTPFASTLSRAA